MRLCQLTRPDTESKVKDESLLDTLADLHNYADYALQLFFEGKMGHFELIEEGDARVDLRVASIVEG